MNSNAPAPAFPSAVMTTPVQAPTTTTTGSSANLGLQSKPPATVFPAAATLPPATEGAAAWEVQSDPPERQPLQPVKAIDTAPTTVLTAATPTATLVALQAQLPIMLTAVHECHVWMLTRCVQATAGQLTGFAAGQQHLDRLLAAEPLDLTACVK